MRIGGNYSKPKWVREKKKKSLGNTGTDLQKIYSFIMHINQFSAFPIKRTPSKPHKPNIRSTITAQKKNFLNFLYFLLILRAVLYIEFCSITLLHFPLLLIHYINDSHPFLHRCTALSDLCRVRSPTNALLLI